MKTILTFIFLLVAVVIEAAPFDTNNLNAVLADENGIHAWPTNEMTQSLTVSNYNGSGWSLQIGGVYPLDYTNVFTGASFILYTNGHWKILDQYDTLWSTGTNGVFNILQTNGVDLLYSNGSLSITSNGLPWGTISAATLSGGIASTNVGALTNYPTFTIYNFGTNWLYTNFVNQINITSNSVQTNDLQHIVLTNAAMLAIVNTSSNFVATNAQGNLIVTSNFLYTTLGTSLVALGNSLTNLIVLSSNSISTNLSAQIGNNFTNGNTQYAFGTNWNYTNMIVAVNNLSNSLSISSNHFAALNPVSKSLTATIPSTFTSQGIAFNVPLMPDGNYSVTITPQDSFTAAYPGGKWISSKTGSGFTINIPVQTNSALNYDAIITEKTQ